MKKEEEDNGFLKGSRTAMNSSNSCIYKGLKKKIKQKKKEKEED